MNEEKNAPSNFIKHIIDADLADKKMAKIITRFPPEPNGYLHIGHAKSICLNFGLAQEYNGTCHLRFDDTNPEKEEDEFVKSIIEDVKWLGFDWKDNLYYASDYFEKMYNFGIELIKADKAFVCDLNAEDTRKYRGSLTEPGKDSPFKSRSIEENLELFEKMKNGEFEEGSCVLRAKIDMASGNMNMRDPSIYRIVKQPHHRSGSAWNIYPMYDFAHCIEDALEKITHSLCTLEFEDHRPLYDWFLDNITIDSHPQQIEFARLNITHTILSKRNLSELVKTGAVTGWDDPRMPTLAGMRRRGYPADAIRNFCDSVGVAKANSTVDVKQLHHFVRQSLTKTATRVMAVLDPLKVVITNFPEGEVDMLDADNNPEDENAGKRKIPFSKELYIEQEDFMENPPPKYFRLSPGTEVRFKHAFYITCNDVIKDDQGNILEIHCTYDPETRGGWLPGARKVKGTLHWVSAQHAVDLQANIYDNLFTDPHPKNMDSLNTDSLSTQTAKCEPSLKDAKPGQSFQFLRKAYFGVDTKLNSQNSPIFNQIVTLKDSFKF